MAATAQDPPRTVAGREGPLKWAPNPYRPKDEWIAPDGDRAPARIRFLSNNWLGSPKETFYAYRNGRYLGVRYSLADAKKLCESDKPDPSVEKDRLGDRPDDIPAFLVLSKEERRHLKSKAPPLTMGEMRTSWRNHKLNRELAGEKIDYMSKYETMGVEQLAREYNSLVETARGLGLDSFRPVARFRDKDEGLIAIQRVESSIRARQASEKAVKQ